MSKLLVFFVKNIPNWVIAHLCFTKLLKSASASRFQSKALIISALYSTYAQMHPSRIHHVSSLCKRNLNKLVEWHLRTFFRNNVGNSIVVSLALPLPHTCTRIVIIPFDHYIKISLIHFGLRTHKTNVDAVKLDIMHKLHSWQFRSHPVSSCSTDWWSAALAGGLLQWFNRKTANTAAAVNSFIHWVLGNTFWQIPLAVFLFLSDSFCFLENRPSQAAILTTMAMSEYISPFF